MLKRFKKKSGFTLSELIIVIAILVIIVVIIASFGEPIKSMIKSTSASADALSVNKSIGDYVEGRLSFADKIYVCSATNYDADTTQLQQGINYVAGETGLNSTSRALIFHYEEDSNIPSNSTYKLYDVPITDGVTTVAKIKDAIADKSAEVFIDEYYGNNERLVVIPPIDDSKPTDPDPKIDGSFTLNTVRRTAYMTIDIHSYDFDGSFDADPTNPTRISDSSLNNYYDQYNAADADTNQNYEMNKLNWYKTGNVESVTFQLHNIINQKLIKELKHGYRYYNLDSGADTVIFYRVPEYEIS